MLDDRATLGTRLPLMDERATRGHTTTLSEDDAEAESRVLLPTDRNPVGYLGTIRERSGLEVIGHVVLRVPISE